MSGCVRGSMQYHSSWGGGHARACGRGCRHPFCGCLWAPSAAVPNSGRMKSSAQCCWGLVDMDGGISIPSFVVLTRGCKSNSVEMEDDASKSSWMSDCLARNQFDLHADELLLPSSTHLL